MVCWAPRGLSTEVPLSAETCYLGSRAGKDGQPTLKGVSPAIASQCADMCGLVVATRMDARSCSVERKKWRFISLEVAPEKPGLALMCRATRQNQCRVCCKQYSLKIHILWLLDKSFVSRKQAFDLPRFANRPDYLLLVFYTFSFALDFLIS